MGRTEPTKRGRSRGTRVNRAVRVAVLTALAGLLAACGSSASATGAATSPSAAATSPGSTASPAGAFVNIVEPFDPGHPARTRLALANCGSENTTIAIEGCYEIK